MGREAERRNGAAMLPFVLVVLGSLVAGCPGGADDTTDAADGTEGLEMSEGFDGPDDGVDTDVADPDDGADEGPGDVPTEADEASTDAGCTSDEECNDGDPCNGVEVCDPVLGCRSGPPVDCDDGIACTTDACDPLTGACGSEPDHSLCTYPELCQPDRGGCAPPLTCSTDEECSDGNPCNGAEYCGTDEHCAAGTPVDCDDGFACTTDRCNPIDGTCIHTPDDGACDDGDRCTGLETCRVDAGCVPGTPVDCDDRLDCTTDSCEPTTGVCSHAPSDARCDDAVFCNGAETCSTTAGCVAGTAPDCSDGVVCTVDACHPVLDRCTHSPNDARCDDSQFCNGAETCNATAGCVTGTAPTCNDLVDCTIDRCDPTADGGRGACVFVPPDADDDGHPDGSCGGTDCNDGDPAIHPGATERCNAIDDDCDGVADETFACVRDLTRSCTTSCSSTGSQTCSSSCAWGVCNPPAETCNGADDDCDGATDETFACARGTTRSCSTSCSTTGTETCSGSCAWGACVPPAEACNGLDDDCDGLTDETFACAGGATRSCTTSCSSIGSQTCSSSCAWGVCVPPAETCNGVDDDCDGAVDETFACAAGSTRACTTGCSSTGSQTCSAACGWGVCVPPAETCNGRDDDCDGLTDETFACTAGATRSCTTSCSSTGSQTCSGSCAWGVCNPPGEVCNGRDDDCVLGCDNGFACCAGTSSACSNACGVAGSRSCSSSCVLGACCAASEVCGNTCDDDCDGLVNEGCGPTCSVIEGFESGVWPAAGWTSVAGGGTLSAAYAHDGSYGLRDPDWHYRTNVTVGNAGDRLFAWVRPGSGRTYLGFGASSAGAYTVVLAPNTTVIMFQQNSSWGYTELNSTACTFTAGAWYKLEVEFVTTTSLIGRVYESNGTTVRCQVSQTIVGLAPGGIALRSFSSMDNDTITLCR